MDMEKTGLSRRTVLKSMGVSSATLTGVSSVQATSSIDEEANKIEVREADRNEQKEALDLAIENGNFNKLHNYYDGQGWEEDVDARGVNHITESNGEVRYTVLLKFDRNNNLNVLASDRDNVYLLYNGLDMVSDDVIKGTDVDTVTSQRVIVDDINSNLGSGEPQQEWIITSASVAKDDINLSTRRYKGEDILSSEPVETSNPDEVVDPDEYMPPGGGCTTCTTMYADCSTNYACLLMTAGSYTTAFVACASCVASAGWVVPACGYCIGALLTATGVTISCDVTTCSTHYACVPPGKGSWCY